MGDYFQNQLGRAGIERAVGSDEPAAGQVATEGVVQGGKSGRNAGYGCASPFSNWRAVWGSIRGGER